MKEEHKRIAWVDTAKAIGIILVFYGHVLQDVYKISSQGIFYQYKFIYSFHMPLFFILAGFFFKKRTHSFIGELKRGFLRRLIPVIFFEIGFIPIWLLYLFIQFGHIDPNLIGTKSIRFLYGNPVFNAITWFLVCLLVVELIAYFTLGNTDKVLVGLIISAIGFGIGFFLTVFRFGFIFTERLHISEYIIYIPKNFWYFHEAPIAFGFYAFGFSVYKSIKKIMNFGLVNRILLFLLFTTLTLFTFDLNKPISEVVFMKSSQHGDFILFLITSFSGSMSIILLSSLLSKIKALTFIGKNTLVLIGIAGFFQIFVNHLIISRLTCLYSFVGAMVFSILLTSISILLSVPVINLLNKYIPQLVGKPHHTESLLPDLSSLNFGSLKSFINKISSVFGSTSDD